MGGRNSSESQFNRVHACCTGRIAYEPAWTLQKRIQAALIEAKRQGRQDAVPHILLLVEHPPVFTLGKNGNASHLLLDEAGLRRRDATFVRIDRGGDITYHGPGQLVGYPILDLDRLFTDIGRYLRMLEEVIIATCADYGIEGRRIDGLTGVWVGPEGMECKIAALGVRCSRWVTMHGFAFNLNTDLSYFSDIVPCGITDRSVTSLSAELKRQVDENEVGSRLLRHFGNLFGVEIDQISSNELEGFLDDQVDLARRTFFA